MTRRSLETLIADRGITLLLSLCSDNNVKGNNSCTGHKEYLLKLIIFMFFTYILYLFIQHFKEVDLARGHFAGNIKKILVLALDEI